MDPDVASTVNGSLDPPKEATIYFGVHIPYTVNDESHVFEDKTSALKLVKANKNSRFKAFQFYHEAVDFATNGSELLNLSSSKQEVVDERKKSLEKCVYRTPRPQELTEFRGMLVCGNADHVRQLVKFNPRFLVSSGDTPSILQEGARLNALHVLAKSNNAELTEFVLSTITDPKFVMNLYDDSNQENAEQRCKMLLDLYLNTPNKGFNDTPLHIASKWGADKVMEILLSYPECDKSKRNKHNKLPEDVICERVHPKLSVSVKKKIQQLLCDNFYVPVLRTEDNTLPPLVGKPFSPISPPLINKDPLSPRLEIRAYAGPMDKKEAENFRKVWKTPPRSINCQSPNGNKANLESLTTLRFKDPEKGLERIGKKLANNYNISWNEYWEFLESFVDLSSDEGLEMLEKHLRKKEKELFEPFDGFSELLAKPETAVSPISGLCNAFSACTIQDSNPSSDNRHSVNFRRQTCRDPLIYVDKACQVFANRILTNVSAVVGCSEKEYDGIVTLLETDVRHLELLINSYMSDDRFMEKCNFQKVHSRLANVMAKKLLQFYENCDESPLIKKFEYILETLVKRSGYYSSEDEAPNNRDAVNKPTEYKKQIVCLLSQIKSSLEFPDALKTSEKTSFEQTWQQFKACSCIFHARKPKRNNLSRNSGVKNHRSSSKIPKIELQRVSKKLHFVDENQDENNFIGAKGDSDHNSSSGSSKSESEEEFFTPLSSPSKMSKSSSSDSEDHFSDAEPPKEEVFLEGLYPTKTDHAVFNALMYSECQIDRLKYPLVYKWNHSINLYKESEREAWPSPHSKPPRSSVTKNVRLDLVAEQPCSPKPTWLRVTGNNSPRRAMKILSPAGKSADVGVDFSQVIPHDMLN